MELGNLALFPSFRASYAPLLLLWLQVAGAWHRMPALSSQVLTLQHSGLRLLQLSFPSISFAVTGELQLLHGPGLLYVLTGRVCGRRRLTLL